MTATICATYPIQSRLIAVLLVQSSRTAPSFNANASSMRAEDDKDDKFAARCPFDVIAKVSCDPSRGSCPPQTLGLVSSVYATGRALVPGPLAGVAGSLEHRVTELSLPVISVVQDQSERVRSPSVA